MLSIYAVEGNGNDNDVEPCPGRRKGTRGSNRAGDGVVVFFSARQKQGTGQQTTRVAKAVQGQPSGAISSRPHAGRGSAQTPRLLPSTGARAANCWSTMPPMVLGLCWRREAALAVRNLRMRYRRSLEE